MDSATLPVAVIGAGPVGLAAAAHLVARGLDVVVLEAGGSVGAHMRSWGHVRVFSPWRYNTDPAAVALLAATGWREPDPDELPTGCEIVARYLEPLAAHPAIEPRLRLGARVTSVARLGYDKMKTGQRALAPFVLRISSASGEEDLLARAAIDASGTYGSPNPLGAAGVPAIGEADAAEWIAHGVPDVLGRDRARYAGRRVLVVGSGHSAMGAVLALAHLAEVAPATRVTWAVRRPVAGLMFGGGAGDALPARGGLGARARALVDAGTVRLVTGFATTRVTRAATGVTLSDGATELGPFDEVIAATGFRPDLSVLRELRLALDPVVESPSALAPLIDPNRHSCGSVPPHGYDELKHPEPGIYIVGAKSYGRAPTVLMRTGYEQVRSVVAALAGDMAAAREVHLVLPETGVCASDPSDAAGCAPAAAPDPPDAGLAPRPPAAAGATRQSFAALERLTVRPARPVTSVAPTCRESDCRDGEPVGRAAGQSRAGECRG